MRTRIHHQLWIIAAAAVVFFTNLGGPKLWDEDEPRNASCAREMFDSGDWIVPTFNHELRTDKPVLLYWLMMGSYALFGVTEFAARFPSALLAVGTALMTYHLGRLLFRPQAGLWAGLIMATNLMFGLVARAATPDSTLIFCTTLALLIYVWSVTGGREGGFLSNWQSNRSGDFRAAMPRSWRATVAMYAAMGLATLAKGPVGVLLPCAAIGLFLLLACVRTKVRLRPPEQATLLNQSILFVRRSIARLIEYALWLPAAVGAMQPHLLAAAVLTVALPWYLWVALTTNGAWPNEFFFRHNVQRFMQPIDGHHGSIFFHLLALTGCFFPWAFLLPVGAARLVRRVRTGDPNGAAYLLAGCWATIWFAVFSLAGTKLPSYVVPAYPALAVVGGAWVADWIASPKRRSAYRWLTAAWAALAVSGISLMIGLRLVTARWFPGEASSSWIGLILIAGAGVVWFFHRRAQPAGAFAALVVTATGLFVSLFAVAAVPISQRQNGVQIARTLREIEDKPNEIGLVNAGAAGMIYYADQRVHNIKQNREGVQSFFAESQRPMLVTDAEGYAAIRPWLPPDAKVVEREPRFLRLGEMLVIGRELPANLAANRRSPTVGDSAPLKQARRADDIRREDTTRR